MSDNILYDLMTRLDAKLDALSEKLSDVVPRIVTLETQLAQVRAERDAEKTRRESDERARRSNSWQTKAALLAAALSGVWTAVEQFL